MIWKVDGEISLLKSDLLNQITELLPCLEMGKSPISSAGPGPLMPLATCCCDLQWYPWGWGRSIFLFFSHTARLSRSYLPDQGLNTDPWPWEHRVLSTGHGQGIPWAEVSEKHTFVSKSLLMVLIRHNSNSNIPSSPSSLLCLPNNSPAQMLALIFHSFIQLRMCKSPSVSTCQEPNIMVNLRS